MPPRSRATRRPPLPYEGPHPDRTLCAEPSDFYPSAKLILFLERTVKNTRSALVISEGRGPYHWLKLAVAPCNSGLVSLNITSAAQIFRRSVGDSHRKQSTTGLLRQLPAPLHLDSGTRDTE